MYTASVRTQGFPRWVGLGWIGLCAWATAPVVWAGSSESSSLSVLRALSDKSFKVRMKAAHLAGQKHLRPALSLLKAMALDPNENEVVRAVALGALGEIGEQSARESCAPLVGHSNPSLAAAAEKALLALDAALPEKPFYLFVIHKPEKTTKTSDELLQAMAKKLNARVDHTNGAVRGFGEETFLSPDALRQHLSKRSLRGIAVRSNLMDLRLWVEGKRTNAVCKLQLVALDLLTRAEQYTAVGGGDAWIEGKVSEKDREELLDEVLHKSVDSAWTQLVQGLSDG